jgi:hypothetical protein
LAESLKDGCSSRGPMTPLIRCRQPWWIAPSRSMSWLGSWRQKWSPPRRRQRWCPRRLQLRLRLRWWGSSGGDYLCLINLFLC